MTESISRLWCLVKNDQYPILCHGISKRKSIKKEFIDLFLEALKFDKLRFISFKEPVIIKKVIVPYPSLSCDAEGFEAHKLITESVAKGLLETDSITQEKTSQPIYFSRRMLTKKKRSIVNESHLEQELVKNGIAICYPEQLSFRQQVFLINKHEVIMGTMGSALHNILFDISHDKKSMICLGYKDHMYINYLIIDALKNVDSTYIAALDKDLESEKNSKIDNQGFDKQDRVIDLDITKHRLKAIGIIS